MWKFKINMLENGGIVTMVWKCENSGQKKHSMYDCYMILLF